MPIVQVKYDWKSRGGRYGSGTDRDSEVPVVVVVDEKTDDLNVIRTSGALPAYGTVHPKDPTQRLKEITGSNRAETWRVWDLLLKYTSRSGTTDEDDADNDPNPLNRPAKISCDAQINQRYTIRTNSASNGFPICAYGIVGGDRKIIEIYEPQAVPFSDQILHFEKHVEELPSWWIFEPVDELTGSNLRVNASDWSFEFLGQTLTIQERSGMLLPLSFTEPQRILLAVEGGGSQEIVYTTIRFDIHVRPGKWDLVLPSRAFSALDDAGKIYKLGTYDSTGKLVPPEEPAFLGDDGQVLTAPVAPEDVIYREYSVMEELDFSILPVP